MMHDRRARHSVGAMIWQSIGRARPTLARGSCDEARGDAAAEPEAAARSSNGEELTVAG